VVTSAITLNTALVGAFRSMSQVFYRNSLTVEASNSHASFFATNHTMIRAEQRLALAVYRPSAFHAITALQTA
jgi:HK97 family phage major capsid protein